MPHRQTDAGSPEPGTLQLTLCRSALSSAAEVLATAMAGSGAVGYEHRKYRPQAGVRHHPGRSRRALDVPCAAPLSAASTHSPDRVVLLTAAAACRAVCRACVSPCSMQAAGRALAQGRADARSTPRGQAHLWRDLPSQAWAPVLALAWATQIASTSSTRWPRIRPASRRSRCALFIGRISLRAAVGRCALRQGASRVERLVLRGGCDSLFQYGRVALASQHIYARGTRHVYHKL